MIESIPYEGETVSYNDFVKNEEEKCIESLSKDLSGYLRSAPSIDTIRRAVYMSDFNKNVALEMLQNNLTTVNQIKDGKFVNATFNEETMQRKYYEILQNSYRKIIVFKII